MSLSLKAARVDAGLTQQQVADALNISKNTVANYESYTTVPDMKTGQKLADLYNRSVDEIIFFKN